MASTPSEACSRFLGQDGDATELSEYVLNSDEVAHILDRTPHDVTELARKGKLRAKRMGRVWKFRRRDVTAYSRQ